MNMKLKKSKRKAICLFMIISLFSMTNANPFGYQSVESQGHDIASGLDKAADGGYLLTGSSTGLLISTEKSNPLHIGMHCYAMHYAQGAETGSWVQKYGAHKDGVPVATSCSAIARMGDTNKFAIVGYTEGTSVFSPKIGTLLFSSGSADLDLNSTKVHKNAINGFIVVLEISNDGGDPKLVAGKMLVDYRVNYPTQLDAVGDNSLVVASMVTDDVSPNLHSTLQTGVGKLSQLEPGLKIGNFYSIQIQMVTVENSNVILKQKWSKTFTADDGRGAQVSGLLFDEPSDSIIFSGSTNGSGAAFSHSEDDGNDYDGFVSMLRARDGKLKKGPNLKQNITNYVSRVESLPRKNDFVNGICTKGFAIYIVGTTNSIVEPGFSDSISSDGSENRPFNAFIQKRVKELDTIVWTRQISVDKLFSNKDERYSSIEGLACEVAHDSELVYVSGTLYVKDNTKDIFLAAYESNSGLLVDEFPNVYPIGSSRDESFAGITIDDDEAAVIYGTTDGSLVAQKPSGVLQYADTFLMNFAAVGASHVPILDDAVAINSGASYPGIMLGGKNVIKGFGLIFLVSASVVVLGLFVLLSLTWCKRRKETTKPTFVTAREKDLDIVVIDDNHNAGEIYDVSGKGGDMGEVRNTKASFNELMESYKNIEKDLSGSTASINSTNETIPTGSDDDRLNDREII